ncbi:YveK family protein [Planococcus sp. CAU13]|uniref:YveK family protein n=1 Tax=Planococcus sp. CAU13 TaxID=1541197 RepID=UPI00068EE0DB|nr:Wzz/FepE/Etk N-terminal domain-containing protein [Planococcus sp. CAU13]
MAEKVMVFNILKSLRNHIKLIAGIALLSMAVIWALLTYILAPNYQATSQLYIEELTADTQELVQLETSVDQQVVQAYIAMIKSREVLSAALSSTGSTMTPMELFDRIAVSSVPGSQVLNITVEEKDRKMAGEIANALANAAVGEAWNRMKVDNLSIIAIASVEEKPSVLEENILYVLAIGAFFGTVVGILMAFIAELFNMLFRTGILEKRRKRSDLQTVFK